MHNSLGLVLKLAWKEAYELPYSTTQDSTYSLSYANQSNSFNAMLGVLTTVS